MNNSYFNGISGIKAHQFGIDVWAANITGINTSGFKASSPEFSNIFNKQLTNSYLDPVTSDIGLGVAGQTTTTNFNLGTTVSTESKYDLAINGDGWFGVVDGNGDKYYTRAGAFSKDKDGFLVDNVGNYVTGTSANNYNDGIVIANPKQDITYDAANNQTKINIPDELTIPPVPTSNIKFTGNLNPEKTTALSIETGKEEEIPNVEIFRTNAFDANGDENSLEITFTKVVPQATEGTIWDAKAILKDKNQNPLSTQDGQISFDKRGAIISNSLTTIDNNGLPISLDFGTLYDPNTPSSGFDGLTSFNGFLSDRSTTKDGSKQGNILNYNVNNEGVIVANFDNGKSLPISKIAIFNFQNNGGLEQANPVYYKETQNSGVAKFRTDKDGNFIQSADISSNRLEMSNVDLSTALTQLLIMQKAFDASAKSITTSDQMIQNAINMKK